MTSTRKNLIATEPLFIGRARAHNPGDVVPEENVKEHGWGEQVANEGTVAAKKAQGIVDDGGPGTASGTPAGSVSS